MLEIPLVSLQPLLPCYPNIRLRLHFLALDVPMLRITSASFALQEPDCHVLPLILVALEDVETPDIAVSQAFDQRASDLASWCGGYDGGVVCAFDVAALMRVQDCRADGEQGGVRGCGGCLRAPDYAVQDWWGHEGAVEECCVGHGVVR